MSKSTTPRQPIRLPAPKPDPKTQVRTFFAQRKQAYSEAILVAYCQNPHMTEVHNGEELAALACKTADALLNELFLKDVPKGK